jgi:outer membrane protein assembly factor BamB
MGNYFFGSIPYGSHAELTPSRVNYQFFPPAVIWEGIVEDEVWNFIAVGPPPPPPPPPANQPTLAWSSYFDNSPQLADYNALIGRDGSGQVYVAGTSYTEDDTTGNTDIVLFKTDANGNRVWSRTFDGPGNYKDAIRDMIVDTAGNVYLAGYSYSVDPTNPALNSYDYVLVKYNSSGDLLWSRFYGGTVAGDRFIRQCLHRRIFVGRRYVRELRNRKIRLEWEPDLGQAVRRRQR